MILQTTLTAILITHADTLLPGIATNTLDKPKTAFTDVNGMIIAYCYQKKIGDTQLLLFQESIKEKILQHLETYRRFTKATVTHLERYVYITDAAISTKEDMITLNPKCHLVITSTKHPEAQELTNDFRLTHFLPLQGTDFDKDFILSVDPEAVSFTKGCYLGQEVIARVESRSSPPKKLEVKYKDELPKDLQGKMTSIVQEGNRTRGFVFIPRNHQL